MTRSLNYPPNVDKDELWTQIGRTVNGKPVGDEQIVMILDKVQKALGLNDKDEFLDLGCGNAALAYFFWDQLKSYTGVDISEEFIAIAKDKFGETETRHFICDDMQGCLEKAERPYNKVLLYGCFTYISKGNFKKMLESLQKEPFKVEKIFIGNIPDKEKVKLFDVKNMISEEDLENPQTSIGVWYSQKEMEEIANSCGWRVTFSEMPEEFYGAYYRYDCLLEKKA